MKNKKQNEEEKEPLLTPEEDLTPEEELFCKLVAGGESYKSAMRKSFPHRSKWKDASLYKVASLLANKPTIAHKIKLEKAEIAETYFLSYEAKRAIIKGKIEDPTISERERAKYIELDNKMAGHDAPTKIENSGSMNMNVGILPEVSDALNKLFN